MKTTDWFPPEINPVHVGWYPRACMRFAEEGILLQYMNWWDGEHWRYNNNTNPGAAAKKPADICFSIFYSWRGLAEEPR